MLVGPLPASAQRSTTVTRHQFSIAPDLGSKLPTQLTNKGKIIYMLILVHEVRHFNQNDSRVQKWYINYIEKSFTESTVL